MNPTLVLTASARGHDCGYRGALLPLSLLNHLQDAAYAHSMDLGVSVYDLFGRGLTWVLSRYHVAVDRYPGAGERFAIHTWASGRLRRYYLRDFEVKGEDGSLIARATSAWLMLDIRSRRPVDAAWEGSDFPVVLRRALEDDFSPLAVPDEGGTILRFPVRLSEVDLNRHVNHVHYVQWALESAPLDVYESHVPAVMEVAYLGEARFGDTAVVRTIPPGGGAPFLHHITRESDGAALAVARVHWAPP